MKIYISLPISGRDINEARQQADLMKAAISRKGHEAVSPFDIYSGDKPDYYDHICSDLQVLLRDCDAICMAEDWVRSKGCSLEYTAAQIYGKKRYNEVDGVPANKEPITN